MCNFWTGYASITCSKSAHIPYNLISTIKCNDSSILSFANEYVGDVTIPTRVIKYMYNQLDVVPCGSANQIAVFTSNLIIIV
jgi:hypothetical protein